MTWSTFHVPGISRSMPFDRPPRGEHVTAGYVASPVAVIREPDLDANITAMAAWCARRRVELAPHGKTTLAPEIMRRQLAAGAWGITVANPSQARVALVSGAKRILIANLVVDGAGIRVLGDLIHEHPDVEFYAYVDSVDGVELLDVTLDAHQPTLEHLQVLVELGMSGGRTGCRDDSQVATIAEAILRAQHLRLAGVAGYEGVVGRDVGEEATLLAVRTFLARLVEAGRTVARLRQADEWAASKPLVVTAGGSVYFDEAAAVLGSADYGVDSAVVLRSGCYVVHDHQMYAELTPSARNGDLAGPQLTAALEVWGRVLSVPEPGRAVVDIGRRDISYDQALPVVLGIVRDGRHLALAASVTGLYDQHTQLALADEPPVVGDWVRLGISHPCTTFDKWNRLLLVDGDDMIVGDIATFF